MADVFKQALSTISDRHDRFLEEMGMDAVSALQAEIERLKKELTDSKEAPPPLPDLVSRQTPSTGSTTPKSRRASSAKLPPPIPPLPPIVATESLKALPPTGTANHRAGDSILRFEVSPPDSPATRKHVDEGDVAVKEYDDSPFSQARNSALSADTEAIREPSFGIPDNYEGFEQQNVPSLPKNPKPSLSSIFDRLPAGSPREAATFADLCSPKTSPRWQPQATQNMYGEDGIYSRCTSKRSERRPVRQFDLSNYSDQFYSHTLALPQGFEPGLPFDTTIGRKTLKKRVTREPMTLGERRRIKEGRRICHLLKVNPRNSSFIGTSVAKRPLSVSVTGPHLFTVLVARDPCLNITREGCIKTVEAFRDIEVNHLARRKKEEYMLEPAEDEVSIAGLVDILWMPNLTKHLPQEVLGQATVIVKALRTPTSEELVHEVSRTALAGGREMSNEHEAKKDHIWLLNTVVSCVVIMNLVVMGYAMDRNPEQVGWILFESLCTCVYVFELGYRLRHFGFREYFCGRDSTWNISDTFITGIAVMQLVLELLTKLALKDLGQGKQIASASKATVMLRALRAVRVVRLIKMVRSPMLKDLANMLVGFLIGLPSLLWVLFMFVLILCLFGMVSRLMFGPSTALNASPAYASTCLSGDEISDYNDPDCPVHYIYGEEFFGTVGRSMFTCFRFMLGDYSTRGGKSIVVAFSQEYGTMFDIVFVSWMVVVVFGIFNVITAIFVDTTIAGLKHNDVKRKHALQYERVYVQQKLFSLLERIRYLATDDMTASQSGSEHVDIMEDQYLAIIEDDQVRALLQDLDVEVTNLPSMFAAFDGDDTGTVTLEEFLEGVMKLRGEPQKMDIVGCWVSTRLLHEKIDALQGMVEARSKHSSSFMATSSP